MKDVSQPLRALADVHDFTYHKQWVAENGAEFAEKFLQFIQTHPAAYWEFSIIGDDYVFTLRAVREYE